MERIVVGYGSLTCFCSVKAKGDVLWCDVLSGASAVGEKGERPLHMASMLPFGQATKNQAELRIIIHLVLPTVVFTRSGLLCI